MNGYNPYNQYPYSGYGYQPFNNRQFMQPQQQQMAQPQAQMQQPMQYEMPIQDIRFVTSEEAKAFIVMPNRNALLIDKPNGMAHFKFADGMGQSATECYKFERVNPDGSPIKPQEPTPQVDYSQFVTKKEIGELPTAEQYKQLAEQYNTLLAKFENMQKMITGGKPNGNGTANTAKQGA
jgi:hypothetical protein